MFNRAGEQRVKTRQSTFTAKQPTYIHSVKILDHRGKKGVWTFLAANFVEFVAKFG